jgi:hypothetical protein
MSTGTADAPVRYRVENIPEELKARDRWVVFQIIPRSDGTTKKIPLIAGLAGKAHAKNNDPRTWRPFEVALADAEARGMYLAFVFDRDLPYFFLDADEVVQPDGTLRPDVALLRDQLDTYTERSASGTGLHIIGKGTFRERSAPAGAPAGCTRIERYPVHGPRFCIFTGNTLPGLETIEERGAELAALFPSRAASPANGSTESADYPGPAGTLTDDEIADITNWARAYWTAGRRHHMALNVSGYLGKQGVSREQAASIIETCAADDPDPGNALTACHDTCDNLEAGIAVSGWYGLKDVCGLSDEDLAPLSKILDGLQKRRNATTSASGPYAATPAGFVYFTPTRNGPVPQTLSNFTARIVEEVIADDGASERAELVIDGALGEQPLRRIRVPSRRFASLDWVNAEWGASPILSAGFGNRDRVREAVQRLSPEFTRRHVYEHPKALVNWVPFPRACRGTQS